MKSFRASILLALFSLVLHSSAYGERHYSSVINTILGKSNATYKQRILAVDQMPQKLSVSEQMALLNAIKNPSFTKGLNEALEKTFLNKLLEKLHGGVVPLSAFAETLFLLYSDTARTSGLRGYALQHLARICPLDGQTRIFILEKLKNATMSNEPGIPGTAIIGLWRISKDSTRNLSLGELKKHAQGILENPDVRRGDKISSMMIFREFASSEDFPLLNAVGERVI